MGRWMAALFIASCTGCAASHTRSTELDDFTSEYAEAWCTRVARCGNEWWLETQLGATLGDCPTQLEARVAESDVGTRATAVHEGSVVYHRERVAACLDEIATGDCFGLGVDPCDAVFEGRPPIPFFAVRKKGIILTLVPADEDALSSNRATAETVEHQIHLLLACGAVTGRMRIAPNVRLSDHFAHKSSVLIALSDARLSLRDPASDRPIELVTPQLLVSSETLVGFSETPL